MAASHFLQVQVKSQVISLQVQVKSQVISLQVQVKSQVTKIVTRVGLESKSHDSSQHLWETIVANTRSNNCNAKMSVVLCTSQAAEADPGGRGVYTPPRFLFACQFENSYGPTFLRTLTPPPPGSTPGFGHEKGKVLCTTSHIKLNLGGRQ